VVLARRVGSDWSWLRIHPGRLTAPGRGLSAGAATFYGRGPSPDALARWRGVSFFICQPHFTEDDIDRLQRAGQAAGGTQLV